MSLGLDLRGGVHFMLQVDLKDVIAKKVEAAANDVRTLMRDKSVRHGGVTRSGNTIEIRFREQAVLNKGKDVIEQAYQDFAMTESADAANAGGFILTLNWMYGK